MARAMAKLSAVKVARTTKPGMYSDGGGLYLQISPLGGKSWIFMFKIGRREREMGLGPAHTIGLADARQTSCACNASHSAAATFSDEHAFAKTARPCRAGRAEAQLTCSRKVACRNQAARSGCAATNRSASCPGQPTSCPANSHAAAACAVGDSSRLCRAGDDSATNFRFPRACAEAHVPATHEDSLRH